MKKMMLALLATFMASQAMAAGDYLCSYRARISDNDKYNSSGNYIATQYNKQTIAAIIRQERANFHKFGVRDGEDESDCVFASANNRALLERWLSAGNIGQATIHRIVDGTPVIYVDVYRNRVNVRTQ